MCVSFLVLDLVFLLFCCSSVVKHFYALKMTGQGIFLQLVNRAVVALASRPHLK